MIKISKKEKNPDMANRNYKEQWGAMLLDSAFLMVGDRTSGKIQLSLKNLMMAESEYTYFMISINLFGDKVHPYVCIDVLLKCKVWIKFSRINQDCFVCVHALFKACMHDLLHSSFFGNASPDISASYEQHEENDTGFSQRKILLDCSTVLLFPVSLFTPVHLITHSSEALTWVIMSKQEPVHDNSLLTVEEASRTRIWCYTPEK